MRYAFERRSTPSVHRLTYSTADEIDYIRTLEKSGKNILIVRIFDIYQMRSWLGDGMEVSAAAVCLEMLEILGGIPMSMRSFGHHHDSSR